MLHESRRLEQKIASQQSQNHSMMVNSLEQQQQSMLMKPQSLNHPSMLINTYSAGAAGGVVYVDSSGMPPDFQAMER